MKGASGAVVTALLAALALGGCGAGSGGTGGTPVARVTVTEDGFTPPVVHLPRGRAATVVFTRRTDQTCATEAIVGGAGGRTLDLPLGKAVTLELAADRPDTLEYVCGMGMWRGRIVSR